MGPGYTPTSSIVKYQSKLGNTPTPVFQSVQIHTVKRSMEGRPRTQSLAPIQKSVSNNVDINQIRSNRPIMRLLKSDLAVFAA